ncbi:MAG: carbonic anhydrase family protein [Rhodoferax sp.]|nr:carbonic anhydrase family protein [Rhodoferax sp.]
MSWPTGARAAGTTDAHAAASTTKASAPVKAAAAKAPTDTSGQIPELAIDIKKALREQMFGKTKLTLVVSDKLERLTPTDRPSPAASKPTNRKTAAEAPTTSSAHTAPVHAATATRIAPAVAHSIAVAAPARAATHVTVINPRASRNYIRAKAAALAGHEQPTADDDHAAPAHGTAAHSGAHWSYSGATGPQAWGQLQPEFGACATGKRQSPINIEDSNTLQGPAEPLLFNYTPSNASVVNNGHTVQVEVQGSNTLTVRGNNYALVQVHFHSPSEEQINFRPYAMVAHLVHKSAEGQLAVVAVLLDVGQTNALIDTVWTYMPLDVEDRVRMPAGLLDLKGLLPQDQRYYQFLGSLTTPPCTEGVLWLVLKQPTQISAAQLRLFQQLYPNNARPVQPVNNRPVRSAQ